MGNFRLTFPIFFKVSFIRIHEEMMTTAMHSSHIHYQQFQRNNLYQFIVVNKNILYR